MQKVDRQSLGDRSPDHVAIDETATRIDDRRYWLYAAVGPRSLRLLHVRPFPTYNTALLRICLAELERTHDVDDADVLVGDTPRPRVPLHRHVPRVRHIAHGNRTDIERILKEIERRIEQFADYSRHADPAAVESRPRADAHCYNRLSETVPTTASVRLKRQLPKYSRDAK